jgi:hypothetical protein
MTKRKKSAAMALLDDAQFFSLLIQRLSGGIDADHDSEVILSLERELGIPRQAVFAKLITYCRPASSGLQ